MKSRDIEYELSEWIDGDLSKTQADALRRRLEADPSLAQTLKRYESLESILASFGDEPAPGVDWDLQRQTVRLALEREALLARPTRRWSGRLLRWGSAAAAVAAVVAAVLLSLRWFAPLEPIDRPGRWDVTWSRPAAVDGEVTIAAMVRPASARGEVSVLYSEPVAPEPLGPAAAVEPMRPGVIVISAGPLPGRTGVETGWVLDEL